MDIDQISPGFQRRLSHYLKQVLHNDIHLERRVARVPPYLEMYTLFEARIGTFEVIFAASADSERSPSGVATDLAMIGRYVTCDILVYAAEILSPIRRNRLIAQGTPFVCPGRQLYMPQLYIDLRERYRNQIPGAGPAATLVPTAQAILFLRLYHRLDDQAFTNDVRYKLQIPSVTAMRAFDNLEALDLAARIHRKNTRGIEFKYTGRELFEKAEPYLRNPARDRKYVFGTSVDYILKFAGEYALARRSNLAAPPQRTYAIASRNWNEVRRKYGWAEVPPGDASFVVETWSIDPDLLSAESDVDPLSLYVQFHNHADERVSDAAQSLLAEVKWW